MRPAATVGSVVQAKQGQQPPTALAGHDEVEALRAEIAVEYRDGFLHNTSEKLRDRLNKRIAQTAGDATILLAYGCCANGTAGLQAGRHRLVQPAVDDCIALLLGSRRPCLHEFSHHPGTYYYTRG